MAYTKTNWVNGTTPVNADNMNKIENELEALDGASVVANPTLAGTESDLTGLQVGATKYKVPSGGGGGFTVTFENSNLQYYSQVIIITKNGYIHPDLNVQRVFENVYGIYIYLTQVRGLEYGQNALVFRQKDENGYDFSYSDSEGVTYVNCVLLTNVTISNHVVIG